MSAFVAALPMYDWPERRDEVDGQWAVIRDRLRASGVAAPDRLARRNADLPPVPGGIRDAGGSLVARDPARLPPDELDLATLWRHPGLLVAQTCWGPLVSTGLQPHVEVIGQPDYSPVEGGAGALYSSAVVHRRASSGGRQVEAPANGQAVLPLDLLRGARFAFNDRHSMSGWLSLRHDLEAAGEGMALFASLLETGGHRGSVRAVAEGSADIAAIDCLSWAMARQFEPVSAALEVIGWTSSRPGLPFISSRCISAETRSVLRSLNMSVPGSRVVGAGSMPGI